MQMVTSQDPPDYFAGRHLAYRPDVPSELLRAATPPDQEHPPQNMTHVAPQFHLVHHQYKQARHAPAGTRHAAAHAPCRAWAVLCGVDHACGSLSVHCHLLQLRSAWAIAQALNRTLVLPEFWSGQDRSVSCRCAVCTCLHYKQCLQGPR
jgi:hypothetical protein